MTTRHVERLIDFNHEMMEPLQFHIDEDIHYKNEDVGIRAAGYLYLSGKYKAKEGIRLFQELLEVDILAPFEKITDESVFSVHVKDYDYSVRDGDLVIDICIEIIGIDEKPVEALDELANDIPSEIPDIEEEKKILESELEQEDNEDGMDESLEKVALPLNELDSASKIQQELIQKDLDQMIDDIVKDVEHKLNVLDQELTLDDYMGIHDSEEVIPAQDIEQSMLTPLEELLRQINNSSIVPVIDPIAAILGPSEIAAPELENSSNTNFVEDNTEFEEDTIESPMDDGAVSASCDCEDCDCNHTVPLDTLFDTNNNLDVEDDVKNYVTSKRLTELIQSNNQADFREPIRVVFDLLTEDQGVPVVAEIVSSVAHNAWKDYVVLLKHSSPMEVSDELKQLSGVVAKFNTQQYDDLESISENSKEEADLLKSMVVPMPGQESSKVMVDQMMIHEMNQAITPKEEKYFDVSHARKPLKHDLKFAETLPGPVKLSEMGATGNENLSEEPKLPNLSIPFQHRSEEVGKPKSSSKYPFVSDSSMSKYKERKGEIMNNAEREELLDQSDIEKLYEFPSELKNEIIKETIDSMKSMPKDESNIKPMPSSTKADLRKESKREESKTEAKKEFVDRKVTKAELKKSGKKAQLEVEPDDVDQVALMTDVNPIEDLFEDAESKTASIRIVIAKANDNYQSIANRYHVNEMKLAQHNQQKPIYERTLVILPLD